MGHSGNQRNLAGLLVIKDPYQEKEWRAREVVLNQAGGEEAEIKTYSILEKNNWESEMLYNPCV